MSVTISIVPPLGAPPADTRLAIFCDARNYVPDYDAPKALSKAARYAKKHNVHVVPERFVAGDFLCLCMLSPTGEPLGVQRATHLNLDYRGKLRRSDELSLFDTPFGRVALLVDVDVNMPQVARAAVEAGAGLLIASHFIQMFDFYEDRLLYGPVNAAVSNRVPVAAAAGMGGLLVDAAGVTVAGFSEELPVTGTLTPGALADRADIASGRKLLWAHRALLTDGAGGVADA